MLVQEETDRLNGNAATVESGLSAKDQQQLVEIEKLNSLIRDRVHSVVAKGHTGVYIVGQPGIGKSYQVQQCLAASDVPWRLCNGRMTPMELFKMFSQHHEHVLVLDDIGELIKKPEAIAMLLAALDGDPSEPRLICYRSKDKDVKVFFRGGIIILSNLPLGRDPLLDALRSRIVILNHEPSNAMLEAFLRKLAAEGEEDLAPEACREVAEFVIAESHACDMRLDLRHYRKALQDYRLSQDGSLINTWQLLVRTSMHSQPANLLRSKSKQEERAEDRQLVLELMREFPGDTSAQFQAWGQRTNKKRSTFYALHRELAQLHPEWQSKNPEIQIAVDANAAN